MSIQHQSGSFVSALCFAAVPTAVGCARAFVQQTLHAWQHEDAAETTTLIASELMTNAVTATGTTDPQPTYAVLAAVPVIRVRLSLHGSTLVIEVWDVSSQPPVLQPQSDSADHGRGLHIVHEESQRWGIYFPKTGGKVVWAEIALAEADAPSATSAQLSATTTRPANRTPAASAA